MKVSVVVCTYTLDMYEDFSETVDSIISQTYDDVELIIVVDGDENVARRVEEDYGSLGSTHIHTNDKNVGLLESRNTGAEMATGDVVAFIDDDAVAEEEWVEELVAAYERHDAVAVGGRQDPVWVADRPSFLPEEFYWIISATHPGFPDEETEVRNTYGSNISFKRDIFLSLDGFDLRIGGRKGDKNLQGGETELCARMKDEYGKGVIYNPNAVVGHKVYEYRTSIGWILDRAFWQGYSKRAMERLLPTVEGSDIDEETEYLSMILFESTPRRFVDLFREPSVEGLKQFFMLYLLTACVGFGYLYGLTRYRPSLR